MPSTRRSLPTVHQSSSSKRKASDVPLPDDSAKKQKPGVEEKQFQKGPFCWVCHRSGHDYECAMPRCLRVFHSECLVGGAEFGDDGACPECQAAQNAPRSRFLTPERMKDILRVMLREFKRKYHDKMKQFFVWPSHIANPNIVKRMDLDVLQDNILDTINPYRSFAEIISDVKWIYHNYCVLETGTKGESKGMRDCDLFVRAFQKEIADIEDCPICYYCLVVKETPEDKNFFLKICDPPHDIVWAKLKGSPHWPAKCLRVVNGKAHVRFFHTHDKSNITINKKNCYFISEAHPEFGTDLSGPKRKGFKEAIQELQEYVDLYERTSKRKFTYAPLKTQYKYEPPKHRRRSKYRRIQSPIRQTTTEQDELPSTPGLEDTLNNSEGWQVCMSMDDDDDSTTDTNKTTEQQTGVEETCFASLPSPVLSASMIYEVDDDDDQGNTTCTGLQPVIASTPLVSQLRNFDHQVARSNDSLFQTSRDEASGSQAKGLAVIEDDDVQFISASGGSRAPRPYSNGISPSAILPHVFSRTPEMEDFVRDSRYVIDSMLIRCWAVASHRPQAPELISGMYGDIKRLLAQKKAWERERQGYEEKLASMEEVKRMAKEAEMRAAETEKRAAYSALRAQNVIRATHQQFQKSLKSSQEELQKKMDAKIEQMKNKDQDSDKEQLIGKIKQLEDEKEQLLLKLGEKDRKIANMGPKIADNMTYEQLLEIIKDKLLMLTSRETEVKLHYTLELLGFSEETLRAAGFVKESQQPDGTVERRPSLEIEELSDDDPTERDEPLPISDRSFEEEEEAGPSSQRRSVQFVNRQQLMRMRAMQAAATTVSRRSSTNVVIQRRTVTSTSNGQTVQSTVQQQAMVQQASTQTRRAQAAFQSMPVPYPHQFNPREPQQQPPSEVRTAPEHLFRMQRGGNSRGTPNYRGPRARKPFVRIDV